MTIGVLYRRTVILVSIVRWVRMVSAGDNRIYTDSGLQGVSILHLVSSCRVPELGVFVVGVTNWSGEGVRPKSLRVVFGL
jgi:hypothetical protein